MKLLKCYTHLAAAAAVLFSGYHVQAQCDPTSDLKVEVKGSSATATWTSISNAVGYEYAIGTGETPPASGGTLSVNNTVLMAGLTPDKKYCVFLRTRCTQPAVSEFTKICFTTTCNSIIPSLNFKPDANDPTKGIAEWLSNSGSEGGQYEYAYSRNETLPGMGTLSTGTQALLQGLVPGTRYCLFVRYRCPVSQTYTQWTMQCFTTPNASGISNVNNGNISIAPNPASDVVNISMPGAHSVHRIAVADITGRMVYETIMDKDAAQLNTSSFTTGVYFIRISGKEYNNTHKLVIAK